MSGVDIALALFILLGAYHGYKSGFLIELISLLAIVVGVLAGIKLMGWAMVLLDDKFNIDEKVLPYLAFGVVFLLVVILVNLLGKLIKLSVDRSFLGSLDQAAGALLGLVRTTFMLSVVLWITDSLKLRFFSSWTEGSWLYPIVAGFAPKVSNWIGELLPVFKDVF